MNKVVDDLKKFGTVQRAVLGIKGNDVSAYIDQKKERDGKDVDLGTLTGVYVAETTTGSAVEEVLKEATSSPPSTATRSKTWASFKNRYQSLALAIKLK